MTSANTTEKVVKRRPRTFGQLVGWLIWHCRKGLTPLGYLGLLAGLGLSLYATHSPGWALPALAGVAAGAGAWWFGERLGPQWTALLERLRPERLDLGRKDVLDHWKERGYVAGMLGLGGALCSALAVWGPSEPMGWCWGVGTLAIGGPWWWHYGWRLRNWRRVFNRWAWNWHKVEAKVPVLAESAVLRCTVVDGVTELLVDPGPGVVFKDVADKAPAIASAYSRTLRKGAVTVAEYVP